MTSQRTETGREAEAALREVLAHMRGKTRMPCRIVDDPAEERIVGPRSASSGPRIVRPRSSG